MKNAARQTYEKDSGKAFAQLNQRFIKLTGDHERLKGEYLGTMEAMLYCKIPEELRKRIEGVIQKLKR